jgi:hypothetical protein
VVPYGIVKGTGNGFLPYDRVKSLWPVLARRYDKILHPMLKIFISMRGFKITKILIWFNGGLKGVDKMEDISRERLLRKNN